MTDAEFAALEPGQIIRHKLAAEAMTVEAVEPALGIVWVVRRGRATNPDEWLLIEDRPKSDR